MVSKAKLQYLKNLSQKKHREKEGVFLVEGWRSVEEVCAALRELEILVHTKEAKENRRYESVFLSAKEKSKEVLEVSSPEFAHIADTVTAQGVAAVVKKLSISIDTELENLLVKNQAFVVALDQIADPGNLGAIIRTSDWFGVEALLLSKNCVELYNPKVVRSTVGSIFHMPILDCSDGGESFADVLGGMQKSGFMVFGAEVSGTTDIRTNVWPKKTVLVIGNEARGISPEIAKILDKRIAIPKFGKSESLNAGVAAAVFLSHHAFQQKNTG
jgi:RNA methyltransferase, TrmH family